MSFWLADPDDLDRIATRLDADAGAVRQVALDNVLRADHAHWVSVSAQRYRDVLAADRRRADAAADELERAADLLRAHAEEIRETLGQLARAGQAGLGWFTRHVLDSQPARVRLGELIPGVIGRNELALTPDGPIARHAGTGSGGSAG